jgi:hypothetical protein
MSENDTEMEWKKASASGESGCLELTSLFEGGVAIRDSKLGARSPVLEFTRREWAAFLDGMSKGEFDHLLRS